MGAIVTVSGMVNPAAALYEAASRGFLYPLLCVYTGNRLTTGGDSKGLFFLGDKMELAIIDGKAAMDSRDIARLTKKTHSHVLRDIDKIIEMMNKTGETKNGFSYSVTTYETKDGFDRRCYKLPYRETMILLSGYSVELRAAVVDRWLYLEKRRGSIRNESKKVRNHFTEMLQDHGYTKPGHYIQTTVQMKAALGIMAKKDEMTERELKKIRASEALADLLIDEENGYHEVNPVCVNSCIAITQETKKMMEVAI